MFSRLTTRPFPLVAVTVALAVASTASATSSLHEAARRGDVDLVKALLSQGLDVNARTEKTAATPLHDAVSWGHEDVIIVLTAHGAAINAKDRFGLTPLHSATTKSIAEFLLANGADVHATNERGRTPLRSAIYFGKLAVAETLITHGANPRESDQEGDSLLHEAAYGGLADAVSLLLTHGADVNAKNKRLLSPLHMVIMRRHIASADKLRELLAVEQLLIESGADLKATNRAGRTPLSAAVADADLPSVELLLGGGANPNQRHPLEGTPLHRAARDGNLKMVKLLIEAGADPSATSLGGTPLQIAQTYGHKDVTVLLASLDPTTARPIQFDAQRRRETIFAMLESPDRNIRLGGFMKLEGLDSKEKRAILPSLLELFARADEDTKDGLILAIGDFGKDAEGQLEALLELLEESKKEGRTGRQGSLIRVLGDIARPEAAVSVADFMTSQDEGISAIASVALRKLGVNAKPAKPKLLEIARDPQHCENALMALRQIGPLETEAEARTMAALLETGSDTCRSQAMFTFVEIGRELAIPPLLAKLESPDRDMRQHAATALRRIGRSYDDARIVSGLRSALKREEDDRVASEIRYALEELATESRD